jgi:hypothetical protein
MLSPSQEMTRVQIRYFIYCRLSALSLLGDPQKIEDHCGIALRTGERFWFNKNLIITYYFIILFSFRFYVFSLFFLVTTCKNIVLFLVRDSCSAGKRVSLRRSSFSCLK